MKKVLTSGFVFALFLALCSIPAAEALTIEYKAENTGGNAWQYDFWITNDSLDTIGGFDIEFGYGISDLQLKNVALGWDGDVSSSFNMGEPGVMDPMTAIMMVWAEEADAWLLPNTSLGGFSVDFNWNGNDPIDLTFTAYNGNWGKLSNLDVSFVAGNGPGPNPDPIPEPGTLALLGTGLAGLAAYYRSRKAGKR